MKLDAIERRPATWSACVSYLPFAVPPRFEAWTSTDMGATRTHVLDDRTGKPAAFSTKAEAQRALRAVLRATPRTTHLLPATQEAA